MPGSWPPVYIRIPFRTPIVTTTTHKTLRGPRGGLILARANDEITKKLNSLIFPGTQGGPLMHVIAAKAVAQGGAEPGFTGYQKQVLANARAMVDVLIERATASFPAGRTIIFSCWTLRQGGHRQDADAALGRVHITVNKNAVPNDPRPPFVTSGLRIGTPAVTTRGFGESEVRELAHWIADVLADVGDEAVLERTRRRAVDLCRRYPVYRADSRTCTAPSAARARPR